MHQKASLSKADVIMLDLEDSVPWDEKAAARRQVSESLTTLDWGKRRLAVRINSTDSPFAYKDIIEIIALVALMFSIVSLMSFFEAP